MPSFAASTTSASSALRSWQGCWNEALAESGQRISFVESIRAATESAAITTFLRRPCRGTPGDGRELTADRQRSRRTAR